MNTIPHRPPVKNIGHQFPGRDGTGQQVVALTKSAVKELGTSGSKKVNDHLPIEK